MYSDQTNRRLVTLQKVVIGSGNPTQNGRNIQGKDLFHKIAQMLILGIFVYLEDRSCKKELRNAQKQLMMIRSQIKMIFSYIFR